MIYIPTDPTKHAREKKSKYRNVKTKAMGRKFDSVGEKNRYFYLQQAEAAGQIQNLRCQVKYTLTVHGIEICNYIADFVYETPDPDRYGHAPHQPKLIVEDFKGGYRLPPDWHIKQKLMMALHGIDVKIVKEPTANIG